MTHPEPSAQQPPTDVVRHVIACSPCGASVEGLTQSEDVLRQLALPRKHPALVEHMLGQTARVGKHELGTLLYEMGRASLMLVPEASVHIEFFEKPKPLTKLSQHAKRMSCRVSDANVSQVLAASPAVTPSVEEAAGLSLMLGDAFLTLGWKRHNGLLLRSTALFELGKFEEAWTILDEVVSTTADSSIAVLARRNITRAMLHAGEYGQAAIKAREFTRDFSEAPSLWLNYATAAAWQADLQQFETACDGFRRATADPTGLSPYWKRVLADEVQWFAKKLMLSEQRVTNLLVHGSGGSAV
jgi:hypothetical protein